MGIPNTFSHEEYTSNWQKQSGRYFGAEPGRVFRLKLAVGNLCATKVKLFWAGSPLVPSDSYKDFWVHKFLPTIHLLLREDYQTHDGPPKGRESRNKTPPRTTPMVGPKSPEFLFLGL
uniref:Uncharacterized protein n=1 Tax=Micrurus lemniscatus lemniscatus TaxID=129467 RepID=A0A2D4HNY4_MICLE